MIFDFNKNNPFTFNPSPKVFGSTNAMNEWGFIGQNILAVLGKSATSFKFKIRCGYVREERLVLSNPYSS
jgi:hypothetical protein